MGLSPELKRTQCVADHLFPCSKFKRNVHHSTTDHEGPDVEYRYGSTLSLTSALDGGGWSTRPPGQLNPGKDALPVIQVAGWAPGPLSPLTGIRSPDPLARSESVYRLSYRGTLSPASA